MYVKIIQVKGLLPWAFQSVTGQAFTQPSRKVAGSLTGHDGLASPEVRSTDGSRRALYLRIGLSWLNAKAITLPPARNYAPPTTGSGGRICHVRLAA